MIFKIKTGYKLELLSEETMKLLGCTSTIIDKDKKNDTVPTLENVEVVLVHCNLVNNSSHREYYLLLYQLKNMVN